MAHGWIDDERAWFEAVITDLAGLRYGGLLEVISLVTLMVLSAAAWIGVLAVLVGSVL